MQAGLSNHVWTIGELLALLTPRKANQKATNRTAENAMVLRALAKVNQPVEN